MIVSIHQGHTVAAFVAETGLFWRVCTTGRTAASGLHFGAVKLQIIGGLRLYVPKDWLNVDRYGSLHSVMQPLEKRPAATGLPLTPAIVSREALFWRIISFLALLVLLGPSVALLVSVGDSLMSQGSSLLRNVLPSHRTLVLLLRSTMLAGAVALSAIVVGVMAATLLAKKSRLRPLAHLLFPVMIVVPTYLYAVIWTTCVFVFNSWLDAHGLHLLRLDGLGGTWFAEFMSLLPLATGLALVSLEGIDPALIEAGGISRPPWAVFRKIVLPLAAPSLGAAAGLLFLLSIHDYSVPSLFSVNVYALEIFSHYSSDGSSATVALVSVPLLMVTWLVIGSALSPLRHAATTSHRNDAGLTTIGAWPPWLVAIRVGALLLLVVQVIVPLLWLGYLSDSPGMLLQAGRSASHEIMVTGEIALACVLLSLLLGPVIGQHLAQGGRTAAFWWFVVCVAFALPAPLVGIGVAQIAVGFPEIREGLFAPILANASRFLPISAFIFYAHLRRVDPLLLDAARVFQRNRLHGLLRVQLPLALPVLLVSAAVCLALPMGELGATILVTPPGSSTLMMRLYNLLHYGESAEVAALCLIMMLLVTLAAGLTMTAVWIASRRTVRMHHND